jgi:hypothetical protein
MIAETTYDSIPGGRELINWFGRVPRFHDAELLEISLASKGPSTLRLHTWQSTDKLDDRGYYISDKHIVVTIGLEAVSYVALNNFNLPGIIFDLEIAKAPNLYELSWAGSYGVSGTLRAERMRFDLRPGKPE